MPKKKESSEVRRKYKFIKANHGKHGVRMMCRLLDVAPSGYYAWLKNPKSNRAKEHARLLRLIRASFKASQGVYGAPRVFLDLREAGETCSKHRVARLMRENNMRAVAIVLDLFSRKVIGWAARQTIHRDLVLDAILMAVRQRSPNRTIVHSDSENVIAGSFWWSDHYDVRNYQASGAGRPVLINLSDVTVWSPVLDMRLIPVSGG